MIQVTEVTYGFCRGRQKVRFPVSACLKKELLNKYGRPFTHVYVDPVWYPPQATQFQEVCVRLCNFFQLSLLHCRNAWMLPGCVGGAEPWTGGGTGVAQSCRSGKRGCLDASFVLAFWCVTFSHLQAPPLSFFFIMFVKISVGRQCVWGPCVTRDW